MTNREENDGWVWMSSIQVSRYSDSSDLSAIMHVRHSVAFGMGAALVHLAGSNAMPVMHEDDHKSLSAQTIPVSTLPSIGSSDDTFKRRGEEPVTIDIPQDNTPRNPESVESKHAMPKRGGGGYSIVNSVKDSGICVIL
jgi:hypothetical protein